MKKLTSLTTRKALSMFFTALTGLATVNLPLWATEAATRESAAPLAMLEEINVWGSAPEEKSVASSSQVSVLTQKDLGAINIATTEDAVKFEPSVIIRRRFIGDSNGTLGMRSSHMLQTARAMVFADGVPLHYFLQSRWNGAPRWSLVSADEIAQVEVIYGPFSAEYSGNAMGGVINIETAIAQERTFHVENSYFSQSFDAYGFDDNVDGYKGFVSFGDKVDNLSYYLSYNHLENQSQPQSFFYDGNGDIELTNITGSIVGKDTTGNQVHHYADSGVEDAATDNYKVKIGYEFGEWMALLNVAYEDRNTLQNDAKTYLSDQNGNPIWSGNIEHNDESSFSMQASRLGIVNRDRNSRIAGLRLRGPLAENIELEANVSRFEVLRDQQSTSALNPMDPAYTLAGEVSEFGDTGWTTADLTVTLSDVGMDGMTIITGLRQEDYKLNLDVFSSDNYLAGKKTSLKSASGGETGIRAAFVQTNWDINDNWDLGLGVRYENWKAENGYYSVSTGTDVTQVDVPGRNLKKTSPKFSLGYKGFEGWTLRYSLAKAYRFPIIEELYSQYSAFNSASISNPGLKPENGVHQNFMVNKEIEGGYLRVNLFYDRIKDQIESFTDIRTSVRTFHSMGEVDASGAEFIANLYGLLVDKLDLRFNITHMFQAEIVNNPGDPGLEGKDTTQMPKWRANLLSTYHFSDQWDASFNVQYSSKAWGTLDNSDVQWRVFGAQDAYTRIGLKTDYRFHSGVSLGLGVDNLTNEVSYVYHPWPGRTFYANAGYQF